MTDKEIKEYFLKQPKSEIHSHAGRSGNLSFIESKLGINLPRPPQHFNSLTDMQKWFDENVKKYINEKYSFIDGMKLRWEAGFVEAKRNNIKHLALSFSTSEIEAVGGIEQFIKLISEYKKKYIPDALFEPELTFDSYCDISKAVNDLEKISQYHFFKSIDVCGEENVRDVKEYLPLYQKANICGLIKRMHIGETGNALDVKKAVEALDLDEIHHGIAAYTSQEVMKLLKEKEIILNICPSSNVMLGIVKDYEHHPIKTLVENGVLVTINTDDLLIFNNSIDQEYFNLYINKTLTFEELETIRKRGLGE